MARSVHMYLSSPATIRGKTMETSHDEMRVASILNMVDVPSAVPELPLALRMRLEDVKRTAYHAARARGLSSREADGAAKAACEVEMEIIRRDAAAPTPLQAPPKDAPRPRRINGFL
jgi:hypothetical protein